MIAITITPEMLERAKKKSAEMGQLNNSIMNGAGNLTGFLGEEIVLASCDRFTEDNTYQYDMLLDGKHKVEVKTKLQTSTTTPRLSYEASVTDYNPDQETDFYIFCRVTKDLTMGWIAGIIKKEEYFEQATRHNKGDLDESNNFTFKCDCYNLAYHRLSETLP